MNKDTNHMSVVWTYCSCKGIGKYVRDPHAWLLQQHKGRQVPCVGTSKQRKGKQL